MSITLKIISYQRLTPGQLELFETDLDKFSIGRNPDNNWILPDPQRFLSGTHCWLENRDGTWFVTDSSTNGVFLNGSDQRISKNDSVAIKQSDRIRLGDYELEIDFQENMEVRLAGTESAEDMSIDPFVDSEKDIFAAREDSPPKANSDLKEENTPLSQMDSDLLGKSVSIDDLYHLDEEPEEENEPQSLADQDELVSPLRQHFSAPEVEQKDKNPLPEEWCPDFDEIPDNWDDETGQAASPVIDIPPVGDETENETPALKSSPEAPEAVAPTTAEKPQPASSRQPAKRVKADSAIGAFAAGAGLEVDQLHLQDEEEFFHDLGALFSTMTEGLMQAIASRNQVKSEFRLDMTMIAPRENNPLKFSVSPQEAMLRLLNRTEKAYLSGTVAAAEAIDDINAHQLAVLAGTEAALKSILRRFNPASLESKFSNDSILSKALPLLKKAKYWEFYNILYNEVSEATDDDFQQYFGSEFSSAYEKQLERLKISRKEPSI